MNYIHEFDRFLVDDVNLNQTRIDTLGSRVGVIEKFLTNSIWKPKIRGFISGTAQPHVRGTPYQ